MVVIARSLTPVNNWQTKVLQGAAALQLRQQMAIPHETLVSSLSHTHLQTAYKIN